jgi:hypothetical protein
MRRGNEATLFDRIVPSSRRTHHCRVRGVAGATCGEGGCWLGQDAVGGIRACRSRQREGQAMARHVVVDGEPWVVCQPGSGRQERQAAA